MKIAISSSGRDLDSPMDPRFGRAAAYIIYDTESDEFIALDNTANATLGQGAGIQSAQAVVGAGARMVVTGRVGPNATAALQQAGVRIVTVNAATVREAIEQAQGAPADATPEQAPYGAGMGQGMGQGAGMGMGMGRGMGQGMGMGQGAGMGMGMGRGMGQGMGMGRGRGMGPCGRGMARGGGGRGRGGGRGMGGGGMGRGMGGGNW